MIVSWPTSVKQEESVKTKTDEHKAHAQKDRMELSATVAQAWSGHSMDWMPKMLAREKSTKEW